MRDWFNLETAAYSTSEKETPVPSQFEMRNQAKNAALVAMYPFGRTGRLCSLQYITYYTYKIVDQSVD